MAPVSRIYGGGVGGLKPWTNKAEKFVQKIRHQNSPAIRRAKIENSAQICFAKPGSNSYVLDLFKIPTTMSPNKILKT